MPYCSKCKCEIKARLSYSDNMEEYDPIPAGVKLECSCPEEESTWAYSWDKENKGK